MTIEAYAVAVSAKLEDGVTPALLRIIETLDKANGAMLDFAANVRNISRLGVSIGRSMGKAAAGATALGDASSGLTRASYVLDTMAASSADLARNMAAARVDSRSFGAGGIPTSRGAGSSSGAGEPKSRAAGHGAAAVGIGAAYGIYENARLQYLNTRAAATTQAPTDQWGAMSDALRDKEFQYAKKYAFATKGRVAPFGETMLESDRLLRTLPSAQRSQLTETTMKYAALEAALKGISLPEAFGAFIGLAHQAGAYSPAAATPLYESMLQASLTTHASLHQISRAASYALPSLHAAGANSPDVMLMLATMMQAGILNTKSGTWLNALAMNALPNSLGSGLFTNKKQNAALLELGLYKDGKSQFYKNGQFDLMKEVALLAAARQRMDPLTFNAATRQAFGMQGQRAASLFSEPQVVANLDALQGLLAIGEKQNPINTDAAIQQFTTMGLAYQAMANATMTAMNATQTFAGPVNGLMSGLSSAFGWTAGFTKKHPIVGGAMDAGLAVGAAGLLGAAWKGGGIAVDAIGKKLIAPMLGYFWKNVIIRSAMGMSSAAIDVALGATATLAEAGVATVALGAAIAGAIGYGLGKLIIAAVNAAAHEFGAKNFDLPAWIGGEAFKLFHGNDVPPAPMQGQSVTVHSPVHIDGKKVADVVTHHQANTASRQPIAPNNALTGFTLPASAY